MLGAVALGELAARLRAGRGLAAKRDIAAVAERLGLSSASDVPVGDDCAAIPDGDGFLLLAIEGFMNEFVAGDPWFAGWCGVMVNVSDVAAMGGRPLAVVDAIWATSEDDAAPVLTGLRAASQAFGVPIVGGHSNTRTDRGQLSVAILGRAKRLLTSFDARSSDHLVAAIDLRGRYREPFANWEDATNAPVARLRADLEVLPSIAESGLAVAAKDISQGGIRLVVSRRFEPRTILNIEIEGEVEEAPTSLMARVVHVAAESGSWNLGCRFARELSDKELEALLKLSQQ